jgi:hypothetical protein
MPLYSYRSAPGLRVHTASYPGTAQELADALAEDCPGDYGVQPDVCVWTGPVTEPPAATSTGNPLGNPTYRALRGLLDASVPTVLYTVRWTDTETGAHHTTSARLPRGDTDALRAAVAARVLGDRAAADRVHIRTVTEAR